MRPPQTLEALQLSANVLLVVVTAVYVALTWTMARETRKGAKAAQISAQSSEAAALASLHAAQIAEAGLKVTFAGKLHQFTGQESGLELFSISANVWIHKVSMSQGVVSFSTDGSIEGVDIGNSMELTLHDDPPRELPIFLHSDESRLFIWSSSKWRHSDEGLLAFTSISYSLQTVSEIREKNVTFESKPGLSNEAMVFYRASDPLPSRHLDTTAIPEE